MATKFGSFMLEKCLDLDHISSGDRIEHIREVQGAILDKIIFIPFDSSYDQKATVFFQDMIQHFFTAKLIEKAYEKSINDEQRAKII